MTHLRFQQVNQLLCHLYSSDSNASEACFCTKSKLDVMTHEKLTESGPRLMGNRLGCEKEALFEIWDTSIHIARSIVLDMLVLFS